MPRITPVGAVYLPNETLWGAEKPTLEVAPNHIWVWTGNVTPSGPVDMKEWKVVHVNQAPGQQKKLTGKDALKIGAVGAGLWWLLL